MLVGLDDTLLHQAPATFDHAVTSDHRFFDRWAVGVQHDELSLIYGLATYKNTNTCDGFLCVQRAGRQYNLRLTRPLRPDVTRMGVGPLAITVTDPLRAHHLVVDRNGASPLSCDIEWIGITLPREEAPHFVRRDGRVVQDYLRYDQLGQAHGWVAIGDETIRLHGWFAWRDHSWGVRPGMGGMDPVVPQPGSTAGSAAGGGSQFVWIALRAGPVTAQFQVVETSTGVRQSLDGHVTPDLDAPAHSLEVVDVRHRIQYVGGHTAFEAAELLATTADGGTWRIEATPRRPPWAFIGSGYSGGWDDGLGLGVPRGERLEADEYDVSHAADVVFGDGRVGQPWHRETDVHIRLETPQGAAHEGDAHLTVIARPPLPAPTLEP